MKAKDLRNSILQMAVQGKLVPQDPSDEPASVLLERIRAERAKLIKEKKIKAPKGGESVIYRASDGSHYEKRGKGEPICIDDEIPFEIPESWAWTRIETISTDPRYGTSAKSQKTGELPVLRMGNITKDGGLDYSNLVFTSDKNEIETYRLSPGAVIFNRTNSREWVGKTAYYDGSVPAIYAGYLIAFYPIQLLGEYVNYAMCSPYERDWCKRVKSDGINQSNINSQKLKSFLLPVPPLEEQKRIVSLLNETMPYVDQYSALEDARERLDAELPDRLRKSILQMAVQGKLVSQDPADEPASALLERIRAERAKLIKEKKLKAPKGGESVIYRASDGGYYEKLGSDTPRPIEVPFEIPESWEWARLGQVVNIVSARRVHQSDWRSSGVPFYRAREIVKLSNNEPIADALFISNDLFERLKASGVPQAGDLMVTGVGTIGTSYIVRTSDCFYYKDASVLCFENRAGMHAEYLQLLMKSDFMLNQIRDASSGTTVATITMKNAGAFFVPTPPIEEQKRIVIRCEELLAILH